MLKTFVGYIDLKDVIHQIEENKTEVQNINVAKNIE